ncbi:MAG TPA: energy transducer TonB [Allosphingosinicella sp.]|jgi:TonB family protein
MRYVDGLISVAALAAATVALPGEAAPGRQPWAQVGEWEVSPNRPGSCSAARVYPGGTRVSVSSDRAGYASLSALNRDWSMRTAAPYKMGLVQDGSPRSLAAEANPYSHGLGVLAESGRDLLAQLAGGGILEITHPDGRLLERVDLGDLAAALARLDPCISEVATVENFPPVAPPPPPPPPMKKVRPARAPASLASLFSSADYPAAAVQAGEEGAVGFRLTVGRDGRVTACSVTASSGSASLDSTTCALITRRARFQPARDHKGEPTEDSFNGRIVWRLPEPEPEPEPPPPPPSP